MSENLPPPPRSSPGPAAGWYPFDGGQRWWDGAAWGPMAPPSAPSHGGAFVDTRSPEEAGKTMALFCHLGAFILAIFLALIFRQTEGQKNTFVKHHATEALNFQLTIAIIGVGNLIGGLFLAAVTGGIWFIVMVLIHLALIVVGITFSIIAAIASNRGEWYRYPINWRMVPGATEGRPVTPG